MKSILLSLAGILLLALTGCYYDKESELYPAPVCETTDIKYSTVIKPILSANCATPSCHGSSNPGGGYDLTTYNGVKVVVDNGELMGSITHASGYVAMPKDGPKLPDCQITQITTWVNAGALNN